MPIKSLRLRNICQHEALDWDFNPGLVGVLGRNGSGKSNAMNAAYAALSGDFSRHTQGKSGYIKQGSTGPSYIELVCEHAGAEFTVRRSLVPDKKLLEVGGRSFTKVSEIEEKLQSILGCSPTLLDQYAFVAQWEMFSFLGTTAQRAKQFTELCGTKEAEDCWAAIGARIGQDEAMSRGVVDNSVELKQQIAEYAKLRKEADDAAKAAKAAMLSAAKLQQCEDTKQVYAERQTELKLRAKLSPRLEELNGRIERLQAEDVQKYVDAEAAAEAAIVELQEHLEALRDQEDLAKVMANVRSIRNRLNKLVEPKPPAHKDLQPAEEFSSEIASLTFENTNLEDKLESLDGNDVCPTCGTSIMNVAWQPEDLHARIAANNARLAEIRKLQAESRQYEKSLRDYKLALAPFESTRDALQQQLAELPEYKHVETEQLAAHKAQLQGDIAANKTIISTSRAKRVKVDAELNAAIGERDSLVKQMTAAGNKLKELRKVIKTDVVEADRQLEAHRQAERDLAVAVKAKDTYAKVEQQNRAQLQQLKKHIDDAKKADGWLSLLNRVRDVMHRNKIQAVAHQLALEDLTARVNKTLSEFNCGYRVVAGEQLQLMCHFRDGTVLEAAGLSGGLKMTLAMAYRLALSSIFARTLGMMVLDEPTLALDEDNRERMAEVFQKLGRVARNRGCQIIVITHDELLCPAFDQVIRVGE